MMLAIKLLLAGRDGRCRFRGYHGQATIYDGRFSANRCAPCGHRVTTDGITPARTRELTPGMWLAELTGRAWARRAWKRAAS